MAELNDSTLGKAVDYQQQYDASLLFPISRQTKRDEIHVPEKLPFAGVDIWNAYELSWLNDRGKPQVAIAEMIIPCTSPNIIESKSMKLYFNSHNQQHYASASKVRDIIARDLSLAAQAEVQVRLYPVDDAYFCTQSFPSAILLDDLDVTIDQYTINPSFLCHDGDVMVEEALCSHLLKSNCLVTNQPDWASIYIRYKGQKIDHTALLKYLISFRCHNEFHEQCVERIFMDVMQQLQPQQLSVYARYTRRGGLDINPFRSNVDEKVGNIRLHRQ